MSSNKFLSLSWIRMPLVLVMAVALVLALSASPRVPSAQADEEHTHFRFGHITWEQVSGNTVDFNFVFGARANGYGNGVFDPEFGVTVFNCPTCAPGAFAGVGDVIDETIGATAFCFGDGACTGQLQFKVLPDGVDPAGNWLLARALEPGSSSDETLTHTYASTGPFTAFIDTCCRISPATFPNAHINNPSGGYRIETIVDLAQTSASPQGLLPPAIIDCPQDDLCSFFVTAVDPDGQPLRWRFSSSSEAGGFFVQPGPPDATNAASIDPNTGLYTWDTTGATLGPAGFQTLYSTQVTIEDLDGGGNVASKSAIDFFIRLVEGDPPEVEPQSPEINPCGLTLTVTEGNLLEFTMVADDADAEDVITLGVIELPPGASFPIPAPANPVSSTFSWTPAAGQAGSYIVVFTATDSTGLNAPPCGVAIVVEPAPTLEVEIDRIDMVAPSQLLVSGEATFSADASTDKTVEVDPNLTQADDTPLTASECAAECRLSFAAATGVQEFTLTIDLAAWDVKKFGENVTFDVVARAIEDGQQVEDTEPAKILLPVVLVHGWRGSAATFANLVPHLEANDDVHPLVANTEAFAGVGYRENPSGEGSTGYPTLFRFVYDSEGDNVRAARNLKARITNDYLPQTYASRAMIVAHSMGGNVSRYYINRLGGNSITKNLVMLGTPIEGTPLALAVCDARVRPVLPGPALPLIGALCTDALQDLLPTYPSWQRCIDPIFGPTTCADGFIVLRNNGFLTGLNRTAPASGPAYCSLYGSANPEGFGPFSPFAHETLHSIIYTQHTGPLPDHWERVFAPGDGIVPASSARADNSPALAGSLKSKDIGAVHHTGDDGLHSRPDVMDKVLRIVLSGEPCEV